MSRENACLVCHEEFASSLGLAEHKCTARRDLDYSCMKILLVSAEKKLREAGTRLQSLHALLGRELTQEADQISSQLERMRK